MSKIPPPASSHSKPNVASSAWSRLVNVTKTASKTSRQDDAKVPISRQFAPASASTMPISSRPAKRRRITGLYSQSAQTPSPTVFSSPAAVPRADAYHARHPSHRPVIEPAPALQYFCAQAEEIEVCLCLEGEPPLADAKCSLSRLGKCTETSTEWSTYSPARADLRTFWGHRGEELQSRQEEISEKNHELETGITGKESGATGSAEVERTLQTTRIGSEGNTECQLQRQSLGRATSILSRKDNTDMVETAASVQVSGAPAEAIRTTEKDTARFCADQSSSQSGFSKRWRSKPEQQTGSLDNEPGYDGDATTKETELERTPDAEAETPRSPTLSSGAKSRYTTVLYEATPNNLNRAPEPTKFTTPTSPPSSTSPPNDKENRPTRKPKRRLTLHDTHHQQQSRSRRATAPKQTVQTTLALAIGGNAGMRECKFCDTVYNPLHPEDVKVHAKRHAGAVRREKGSAEE